MITDVNVQALVELVKDYEYKKQWISEIESWIQEIGRAYYGMDITLTKDRMNEITQYIKAHKKMYE